MAVCWAGDSRVIMADSNNGSLKMFHRTGPLIETLMLKSNATESGPWDITQCTADTYAVAIPRPSSIAQVTVRASGQMFVSRLTKTLTGYGAIAYHRPDDVFICGSVPPFGEPCVDVVITDGRLLRRLRPRGCYFAFPKSIAVSPEGVIIVGDWYRDTITFMTSLGEAIGIYPNSTTPQAPSSCIQNLKGLALAASPRRGSTLLVTDGNGVKMISIAGRQFQNFCADMGPAPKVLAVNYKCNKLLVGMESGRMVAYRLDIFTESHRI
jgi:hypothetical protein